MHIYVGWEYINKFKQLIYMPASSECVKLATQQDVHCQHLFSAMSKITEHAYYGMCMFWQTKFL